MSTPSIAQLKQAVTIAEQIEKLQAELVSIIGGASSSVSISASSPPSTPSKRGGKRKMSAATIAKMRASQQARWAKKGATILDVPSPLDNPPKAPKAKEPKASKKKRNLSPEGRARIVAALKARHAAKKAAAK